MNAVMSVPIRTVEEDLGGVKDGRAGLQGATGDGAVEATPARAALNVWQTDGRPMSGDTGRGATTACVRLAQKVLATEAVPFGDGQHFVQLAGGTNDRTAPKLLELGLIGNR
ncbi:unnamed protein product, partial [Laminaria digitata]